MALVAVLVPIALVGCSDGTGPSSRAVSPDTVVLGLTDGTGRAPSQTLLLDGRSGARLEAVESVPSIFSVDPVNRELVGTRGDELVGFGFPALDVRWRIPLEELASAVPDGFGVGRDAGLDRGGRWIFVRAGAPSEGGALLVLDRSTREAAAFLGGFTRGVPFSNTIASVEPATGSELVVIGGTRQPDGAIRLLILDSPTLTVQDSVELRTGLPPRLSSVASARDGRHVFALTLDSLFKVDVVANEIVDRRLRARRGVRSDIVVSTAPFRLFLTDLGEFLVGQSPGSGLLQVYDGEDLSSLGRVSLATAKLDDHTRGPGTGRPLFMRRGAVGEGKLYVRSGNGPVAPPFSPLQPITVSVVDIEEMALEDTWLFDDGIFAHTGGLAVF